MDEDTIAFLRTLCSKVKEIATICDNYLERESKKSNKKPFLDQNPNDSQKHRLIPVSRWNDYHDWPKANSLRWMLFCSHKSGADYFIRRVGRRVLICEKSFFEWAHMSEEQRIKNSPDAQRFQARFGKR